MESLLNFEDLINSVKGKSILNNKDCFFTSVQTDSRNVTENTLFVPLMGEFQNGHKYIPSSIEKGASVIFIDAIEYEGKKSFYEDLAEKNSKVLFLVVKNTLHALQDAAERYVSNKCKNMIKISITGSSGKTTTKEMMVSVCKAHFGDENVAYTKGNFNSETGLPLTAFTIKGSEKVCILEMGMNRENEIGEISKILKSEYGIITNIGTAHIGLLGSRENIAREKRKSLDYITEKGACVVGVNDDYADFCTENVKGEVIKVGKEIPESVSGVSFIKDNGLFGSEFTVDKEIIKLPLSGEYNYLNALSVIAIAKKIGINAKEIKKGLENIGSISGRMEVKEIHLKNDKTIAVIKDCYNANLDSMSKVIEFTSGLKDVGEKLLVLADMKELGSESENAHRAIGKMIKNMDYKYVFLIGSEMEFAYKEIGKKDNVKYYTDSSDSVFTDIANIINEEIEDKDVVLLKGSHSMNLEKLYTMLICK